MSAVSDAVLNWLSTVLRNEYHNVNRTYGDTAQALAQYPSLAPRTEVYTYENGASALLLLLSGTIPVPFRGTTYRFPVALWVPHAYPREAPIVYVTPVEGMLVRSGQHVSGDGRVYHPYLARWATFWDKSSLLDLIALLKEIFAKEPPVISKQAAQNQPAMATPTPPPVPPPPVELRRPQQYGTPGRGPHSGNGPPPLPPKGNERMASPANGHPRSPDRGPPLPPLPHLQTHQQRPPSQSWRPEAQSRMSIPPRQDSLESGPSPYTPNTLPPHMRYQQSHHELESPVSPITPSNDFQRRNFPPPQQMPPNNQPPQQSGPPPGQQYQQYPPQYAQPPPQQQRKAPQPQIDLLSSPLDVQLPSQTGDAAPLPVPPVPPNPQKDALLHALSQALVSQAHQTISSNAAAAQSLSAQQMALRNAHSTLQSELDQLAHLNALLESNERVLHQAIGEIDSSISSAAQRRRPEIDEILVCPTVVGQQVYTAVAEAKACEEVRRALGRALDRGRIPMKGFVTQMRGVGREEFLRKALVAKAGRGMGLEVAGGGGQGSGGWR